MPARRTGSLRKAAAVVFTSLVVSVLVGMATQEATNWQKALHRAPAAATANERPRVVQPPCATTSANHAESSPAETPLGRKIKEWLSAAAPRGR